VGPKFKVTTHGRSALAGRTAYETAFKLTRVAFGSGLVGENTNLADVHELVCYEAEGAVGKRRHENDRLYFTIQYNNISQPGHKTFYLSEFLVYGIDPDTGQETDIIYGTLGDYRQAMPAYSAALPPSVFSAPLTLVISDEAEVYIDAPAGLVTYDELIDLLNSRAAGASKIDVTVPVSGWVEDTDTNGAYAVHLDIASTDITEDMVPLLTVLPDSVEAANACGFCSVSRTLPGLLRVYAKSVPINAIRASLTLLDTSPQHSGLASSAATARFDIAIPISGWTADAETNTLYVDIPQAEIDDDRIPVLTIYPECLAAANACGLLPYTQTLPGILRVYAKSIPSNTIQASLTLLGTTRNITGNIPGSSGEIILPAASAATLGGVKVKPGSGLTIDSSGNLALDTATNVDVANLFNGSKALKGME